jgi:hypothetical protein
MREDQHRRSELVAADRRTSVAVPSSQVVLSFRIQRNDRPIYGILSGLFAIAATAFFGLATGIVPGLPGSGSPLVIGLCGVAAAITSAVAARALFFDRRVEVTSTEVRIPGALGFLESRLQRSSITEVSISSVGGNRCLVIATPTRRAVLQQRLVEPDDWKHLVAIIDPTAS